VEGEVGCEAGTAGLFEEAVPVEEVIEGESGGVIEGVVDWVIGQGYSRYVLVGWIADE